MPNKPKFKENHWSCPKCNKDPYKGEADCVSLSLGDRSICWCGCGAVSIEDVKDNEGFVKTVYNFVK